MALLEVVGPLRALIAAERLRAVGTWLEMQVQANFEADIVRHFLPTEDPCPIP